MAADLDFDATVEVLLDYCEAVALIGPLDWRSFVHGYRAWRAGKADFSHEAIAPDIRSLVPFNERIA